MAVQETKSMNLSEIRAASVPVKESELPAVTVGFDNLQGFELAQRAAKLLATSSLVPKDYQGNIPNCVIALNMAHRMGADPLMVMQNLYLVHGRPAWSAQFLIATFNSCGRFSSMRFEFTGTPGEDSYGCKAWAFEKGTKARLEGAEITIALAKAEGWYGKSGSKWKTMAQQMLMYRAASWFVRAYAPELSMGLHTTEELRDVYDIEAEDSFTLGGIQEAGGHVVDEETGEVIEPVSDDHVQPSILDQEVTA